MSGRATMAAVLGVCVLALAAAPGGAEGRSPRSCATKALYGRELPIRVVGDAPSCERVAEIVRGTCHDRDGWTCLASPAPGPVLKWVRTRELFRRHRSVRIEAVRWPCDEAEVTPESWAAARGASGRMPTRTQLLADDVIRCGLLRGMSRDEIVALLGRPDPGARQRLWYQVGPERSIFSIDSEYLVIGVERDGSFHSAELIAP
jgi:hypothetical protein